MVAGFIGAALRNLQLPASEFAVLSAAGVAVAVAAHEMGHFLCARMLGVPVRADQDMAGSACVVRATMPARMRASSDGRLSMG
jgi:hypothetical protein